MAPAADMRTIRDQLSLHVESGALEQAACLIAGLHPADGAELLTALPAGQIQQILTRLEAEQGAEILAAFDPEDQVRIASLLSPQVLSGLLDEMAADDAADVLGELEPAQAQATLATMEEAAEVRELLGYDEDSAGGLMSPHIITLRAGITAQQALDLLRRLKPEQESAYYLYVVERQDRLVGVLSLRQLVIADSTQPITEIMNPHVVVATVDTDQEECARILARYDLLALPIVDHEQRLVGAITADDIIDVIEEEATEDIYRLANLDIEEDVEASLFSSARRRLFWLMINLPTAILAGWVVSRFEGTFARVAALVSFMPIVAGMGGNAGIQTLTLIVRSMALGELAPGAGLRVLMREAIIGAVNGVVLGGGIALLALVWEGNPLLGVVVGAAMLLNIVAAAIAGTVVPLTLKLLHIDPALASGVIVTTVTDVTGYCCLFGLAMLLLAGL